MHNKDTVLYINNHLIVVRYNRIGIAARNREIFGGAFLLDSSSTLKDGVTRFLTIYFFCLKDSTWAPYEQAKKVSLIFRFHEDIREKHVSALSA